MADSFLFQLVTQFTNKTTAADTDVVPIADANGNLWKMTFAKLKSLITDGLAKAIHTHTGMFVEQAIGYSDNSVSNSIYRKWKDGSNHDILIAQTDLLTTAIGWNGKTDTQTYNTALNLRGKSITCNGSTSWSSDRNLKHSICDITDPYEKFFRELHPVTYQYDLGSSGRNHIGYIAQEVEQALYDSGLTTQDFAGFVSLDLHREQEYDEEGNLVDVKGSEVNYLLDKGLKQKQNLAYTEFIALNTYMIQKCCREIAELKEENKELKSLIGEMKDGYN
jgi:hypothetical protein